MLYRINKLFAFLLICIIKSVRPLLGPAVCHFYPSCTHYAIDLLSDQPLMTAICKIIKRVFMCNPISRLFKNRYKSSETNLLNSLRSLVCK